jgi:hypothetical protein
MANRKSSLASSLHLADKGHPWAGRVVKGKRPFDGLSARRSHEDHMKTAPVKTMPAVPKRITSDRGWMA